MAVSADLVRTFDEVLAEALPRSALLEAAASDTVVGDARLALIDDMGFGTMMLPGDHGGLDLDRRSLASLGWVAGRRLLPTAVRNEALIAAPTLAAMRDAEALEADVADPGAIASGVHLTSLRQGTQRVAHVWGRRVPRTVILATDDGRACVLDGGAAVVTGPGAVDPGQGEMRTDIDGDGAWTSHGQVARAVAHWRLFVLAELLGIAEEVTGLTVDHASNRHQFGRPISGFQAVSHMIADMYAGTELARSALSDLCAYEAERSFETALHHYSAVVPSIVRDVCEAAIQVHGGTGFTWEYGLHLYYRRALASQAALGGRNLAERTVGEQLLEGKVAP